MPSGIQTRRRRGLPCEGNPGLRGGPGGDLVGVTRQDLARILADRTSLFRRLSGNKHPRFRDGDGLSLAKERDRHQWNGHHSPRITRVFRSDVGTDPVASYSVQACLYVCVFIESEGEGS